MSHSNAYAHRPRRPLSEAQQDGRACIYCAGAEGEMVPVPVAAPGGVGTVQLFAHPGCRDEPAPAPGDQLVGFLDQLAERLKGRGLVETDPVAQRWRLSAAGREALGAPRRTGVFERDVVGYLFRLAAACDLDVPHVL